MEIERFGTEGPFRITSVRHHDERGYFTELLKSGTATELGLPLFVQENLTKSALGVVRGLHWQIEPLGQGKLITCVVGKIVDYFLDIRLSSDTFGQVFSAELSDESSQWLWVPSGFAHGFESLQDDTVVMYKATKPWSKEHERTIHPLDPALGIRFAAKNPLLSERDNTALPLQDVQRDSFFL